MTVQLRTVLDISHHALSVTLPFFALFCQFCKGWKTRFDMTLVYALSRSLRHQLLSHRSLQIKVLCMASEKAIIILS